MSKKSASLAALTHVDPPTMPPEPQPESRKLQPTKPDTEEGKATKRLLVYMPPAVHRQLRQLAFDENATMSSLFLQGIDLVFKQHALKPIRELTGKDPE